MPLEVKNVILIGGTSILGQRLVEYLVKTSNTSLNITITSRSAEPPSWFPMSPNYKHIVTDITSRSSLLSALKGQDAAVSLTGHSATAAQNGIVDAAIEAGVKIYIPSSFGMYVDHHSPCLDNIRELPLKMLPLAIDNGKYLDQKVEEGKINAIIIRPGGFFEWGLKNGILSFNISERKAKIYDDGNTGLDFITTSKIGEALARVFLNPNQYLNRTLYLIGIATTQNEILQAFEKKTGAKWTVENLSSKELMETGKKLIETNPMAGSAAIIAGMVYDKDGSYAPRISKDHMNELGIEPDDLDEVIASVLP